MSDSVLRGGGPSVQGHYTEAPCITVKVALTRERLGKKLNVNTCAYAINLCTERWQVF